MRCTLLSVLGLFFPILSSSAPASEAQWHNLDRAYHGDLEAMLQAVAAAPPLQQPRTNRSAAELVQVLQDTRRFEELGLTLDEGRQLVRAVYGHLDLPLRLSPGRPSAPATPNPRVDFRAGTEIEPLAGVLMRWPWDWASMRIRYSEMVDALANSGATIYMWTDTQAQQDAAKDYLSNQGVSDGHVRWVIDNTQTIWIRDYGPTFLHEVGGDRWGVADFHYYDNRPQDDDTPLFVAGATGVPVMNRQTGPSAVYTEGGNMNHDRLGTVCYSQRVFGKNPGLDPAEVDRRIRTGVAAHQSIVPEDPSLDGTGHIDMFAKIVNENTVLVAQYDPDEEDYQTLEDAAALFASSTNGAGEPWNVERIWQPDVYYVFFIYPVVRTYTNSLIVNDDIILPTYNIAYDATAVAVYETLLPGKTIHSIDARVIIESAGAWHCVTMEYPDPRNPD